MAKSGQKRTTKRLDEAGLWEYSLRLLSARAYSTAEMRQRLRRRAVAESDANAVLVRLVDSRFLDDQRFAETYALSRLENQGHGRHRVMQDLRRRKVARETAAEAVEAAYGETEETELIETYLRRKFRSVVLAEYLSEPKNLASAYRRLRHAGFGAGPSIRILKRYSERAEELESMEESGL